MGLIVRGRWKLLQRSRPRQLRGVGVFGQVWSRFPRNTKELLYFLWSGWSGNGGCERSGLEEQGGDGGVVQVLIRGDLILV